VKLNLSKSGVSTSVGKRGATMNFSGRGTKATVGIPGSGLSYSKQLTKKKKAAADPKDLERQVREESGLSRREMKELQRIVRKDPDRLKGFPDAEIASQVRASLKRRQQRSVWIALGLLVILIVYALVKK
jgi:hypothetical protein